MNWPVSWISMVWPPDESRAASAEQKVWEADYYDGHTSTRRTVIVTVLPQDLELQFPNCRTARWPYSDLQQTQGSYRNEPIRLERGTTLPEALVVHDPSFLQALQSVGHAGHRFTAPRNRATALRVVVVAGLASVALLTILVGWGIPVLADLATPLIPASWERKLGESIAPHLSAPSIRCSNPELQESINTIVERLVAAGPPTQYPIQVWVVDDSMFNAFALPGGLIFIHRPLLQATQTPEELAAVLAHEMQHVYQRHAVKALVRDLSIAALVGAVLGDVSGIGTFAIQGARTLSTLQHSRQAEEEADAEGMRLLKAAGVNPAGMIRFFETLKARSGAAELPAYLSTHPQTDDRIRRLTALLPAPKGSADMGLGSMKWASLKERCR